MVEERGSNDASWDADSFERWLQQLASSRDASEDEVLQELASSLWVIDELERLVSETDLHETPPGMESPGQDGLGAPADIDALEDRISTVESGLETLREAHEEATADTATDLKHVEEVLRYLVDRSDTIESRLSTLEDDVANLRQLAEGRRQSQDSVKYIKRTAREHGVSKAVCTACESTVFIAHLSAPTCPMCAATLDRLSPKSGWFGRDELLAKSPETDGNESDNHRAASGRDQQTESADTESNGGETDATTDTDFEWLSG